jgi:hypothetical protein
MGIVWENGIETQRGQPARVLSSDYKTGNVILYVVQYETDIGSMISLYEMDGTPWGNGPKLRNRSTKEETGS